MFKDIEEQASHRRHLKSHARLPSQEVSVAQPLPTLGRALSEAGSALHTCFFSCSGPREGGSRSVSAQEVKAKRVKSWLSLTRGRGGLRAKDRGDWTVTVPVSETGLGALSRCRM